MPTITRSTISAPEHALIRVCQVALRGRTSFEFFRDNHLCRGSDVMGCTHGGIGGCDYGHAMRSIRWVNLEIKSDCIS